MPKKGRGLRRRTRAWAAATAIVAVVAGASAPAAGAVPGNFWGIAPQAIPTAEQFQRLRLGGVDSVRIPIDWGAVQATRGAAINWNATDSLVGGAASAGIEVFPFVTGAPSWAVRSAVVNPGHTHAPLTLPVKNAKQKSGWKSFITEAVRRYGPNGAFWAANPGVTYRPVHVWQLWNEQNFKYFVARPNPAEYGKLLKISTPVIKGIDPAAKVILGGMFAEPKEAGYKRKPRQAYLATDYLSQLYKRTRGVKSLFDGVALHRYTYDYRQLPRHMEDMRRVLKANHDAATGLWITELGWSSSHRNASNGFTRFAKGLQGQAKQLRGAFKLLKRNAARWKLKQVFWFSVDDVPDACNFCDGSGLFGKDFKPKPAWREYVKFAGGKFG